MRVLNQYSWKIKIATIATLFLLSQKSIGQEIYFKSSIGGGINSYEAKNGIVGRSVLLDFSIEKKNNMITLGTDFNCETGNRYKTGTLFKNYNYNSNIWNTSLLYGRTLRKKDWYFTSLSLGIGYYKYHHKSLNYTPGSGPHAYNEQYSIQTDKYSGLGFAFQHEQLFILDDSFGLGLKAFGNINQDRSVVGVVINLVFGILRN
ncbi:MAG: hypothetical protein Q8T03_09015 [Bacteroidota bacterium]|nr:hypothetical protein [Bacteroidota bacterium]